MKKKAIIFLSLALIILLAANAQAAMLFEFDFGQDGSFEDYWVMRLGEVVGVDVYASNVPSPGLISIGIDLVYDPLQLQVAPDVTVDLTNWYLAPSSTCKGKEVEMKGARLSPGLSGDEIMIGTLEFKCIKTGLSELWIFDSDRQGKINDFVLSNRKVIDGELKDGILVARVDNVPIPTTFILLGFGLIALAGLRRKTLY